MLYYFFMIEQLGALVSTFRREGMPHQRVPLPPGINYRGEVTPYLFHVLDTHTKSIQPRTVMLPVSHAELRELLGARHEMAPIMRLGREDNGFLRELWLLLHATLPDPTISPTRDQILLGVTRSTYLLDVLLTHEQATSLVPSVQKSLQAIKTHVARFYGPHANS